MITPADAIVRIMDLNQYLDRMSIKTTIIRIHDVSKAYIRLLTSRASILGRAHEGQKKNSASQQAGGLIKWADILPYFTMFYIVK